MQNYVGEYYSKEWIQKNVLMLTDEDINMMKKEIDGEQAEAPEEPEEEEAPAEKAPVYKLQPVNQKGDDGE